MSSITAAHGQPRVGIHNAGGLQQSSIKQFLWLRIVSSLYNDREDSIHVRLRPIRSWKFSPDWFHHWGMQAERPQSLAVRTGLLPSCTPVSCCGPAAEAFSAGTYATSDSQGENAIWPAIYNSSMISPTQPQHKVKWVTLTWNLLTDTFFYFQEFHLKKKKEQTK